jgi:hypothetical protein
MRRFLCGVLVSKESRRLVLPRTFYYNSYFRNSVGFIPGTICNKMAEIIVYCVLSTQLYKCITLNCLLKLKITTCFDSLLGHRQVNTGTYMCILI